MKKPACARLVCTVCFAILSGLSTPIIAPAAITGILGDITPIAPPPSVQVDALVSNTTMSVFAERTNYTLTGAVNVDIFGVGLQDNDFLTPPPATGTIAPFTRVDVYYVHFDTPGETLGTLFGSISFNAEVLGVAHTDLLLNFSDHLGAPGTLYPTGLELRGMVGTIEGTDFVEVVNPLMGPPQTVRINANVEFVLDGVRIITAAATIPEPTTLWLAVVGCLGMPPMGRRR